MAAHVERRGEADQLQQFVGILAERRHLRHRRRRGALRRNGKQVDVAEHARQPAAKVVTTLEDLVVVGSGLLQSEFDEAG